MSAATATCLLVGATIGPAGLVPNALSRAATQMAIVTAFGSIIAALMCRLLGLRDHERRRTLALSIGALAMPFGWVGYVGPYVMVGTRGYAAARYLLAYCGLLFIAPLVVGGVVFGLGYDFAVRIAATDDGI